MNALNGQTIEKLLRNTPEPCVPDDLLANLKSAIRLPHRSFAREIWITPRARFAQWLPRLAFAVLLLSCLVAIAVQNRNLSRTRHQNELLRAQMPDMDALQQTNAAIHRLRTQNGELERLQNDNAEFQRLRAEINQFQTQTGNLDELRAQNKKLRETNTSAPVAADDFFAKVKGEADRVHCITNLKQLGLAVRMWQMDNNGNNPGDVSSMAKELSNVAVLKCPSDPSHNPTSWADVAAGNISYVYFGASFNGDQNGDRQAILFECPIHHSVCLADGSVQSLTAKTYAEHVKTINGRRMFITDK